METRILFKLTGKKPSKKTRKSGTKIAAVVLSTFLFSQPSICPIALAQSVPLPPANADLPTSASAGDTVVNQGQTHVLDFSNSSSISIANNLMNMGTIYALSTNPAITSGSVNANSIFNFPGAIITSVLPSGGLPGYSNAVGGFSFTLNAINNIVNSGTIASAGDLNLVAGGAIVNALPSGVAGPSPVMQAMQNVNIISVNILNSGAITSALANINVSTVLSQNILINNQLGVLQALNGSLNIRDSVFFEKFNTTIFGGDILAKELNIFSGKGITDISVFNLTPRVNLDTGEAYVKANSNISIGTVAFNGDPTFTSGGDVFLEGDQDGNGPLTVEATGDIINKSAVNVTGTGPIRYHAGGSIQLDGLLNISTNDKVELLADFGSVTAPGTKIEAGLRVAGLAPGPVPGTKLPSSVFVFAHNSIDVGDIKSPDGSILLRAGGDLVGGTYFAGSNQGTLNAGTIDISGERVSGPGQIWIDNFGGNVTLGSLIGDGGRILVQSAGQIQVTGKSDTPAILNNALAARTSGFFTADTILQGNQLTINGGSIESSGGSLQMQSNGNVQFSNVAKVTADDLFSNGAFVRIIGSDSVVFDQSPIFSLQNTSPIPTELQIFSDFGTLSFGSPLTISANATQPDAPGGNVSLGGAAVNFAGKVNISANGLGQGNGGGINIAAGNALSFSKNDIQLVARGGTEGGSGGFVGVAGSGLQIDARSIDVDAGTNGNGGWIRLDGSNMFESGTQLIVTGGALNADGNGTGNGGTVQLINGQSAFVLGGKGANATGINVRSGLEGGNGGTVLAQSGGDLTINTANVNTEARGEDGNGGNIRLRAGISGGDFGFVQEHNGALTINGAINVSGKGVGDGGTIVAEAYSIGQEGDGGGGVGTAAAGLTAVTPQGSIQVNDSLTANAGVLGTGGTILLQATASRSSEGTVPEVPASVLVGTAETKANLRVDGGTTSGDGGTVNIRSNGAVVLSSNVVSANARGNGSGGTIDITVDPRPDSEDGGGGGGGAVASATGVNASFMATENDPVYLNTGLRANGAGTGNGGNITVNVSEGSIRVDSTSSTAIAVTSGADGGNGGYITLLADENIIVNRSLSADGSNLGGNVSIDAKANISFGDSGSKGFLSADSVKSGDGGNIKVIAGKSVTIDFPIVSANSHGEGNAGSIEISSADSEVAAKNAVLQASQLGTKGNGGEVTVLAKTGVATNGIKVDARGDGEAGSIFVDPDDIFIGIEGLYATGSTNGGKIRLISETGSITVLGPIRAFADDIGGTGGLVYLEAAKNILTGPISASGLSGPGGAVVIRANQNGTGSDQFIVGAPLTNGVFDRVDISGKTRAGNSLPTSDVSGGFIFLEDRGTGGISLTNAKSLIARTSDDHNHSLILISAPRGNISINGRLSVDASSSYNAGTLILNSEKLIFGPNGSLSADASGLSAFGGNITIAAERIVGDGNAPLMISANGNRNDSFKQGSIEIVSKGMLNVSTIVTQGAHNLFAVFVGIENTGAEGVINFETPGGLNIQAVGNEKSGNIAILADGVVFLGPTNLSVRSNFSNIDSNGGKIAVGSVIGINGHVALVASGGGEGAAGNIVLTMIPTIEIGSSGNTIGIQARGGRLESSSKPTVELISITDLKINGNGIDLRTNNSNKGASFVATAGGMIDILGDLAVNSTSKQGGFVSLTSGSVKMIDADSIKAIGPEGGQISINLSNEGTLSVGGTMDVTATNPTEVAAPLIRITATNGSVELDGARLISNGFGGLDDESTRIGAIDITAKSISTATSSTREGYLSAGSVTLRSAGGGIGHVTNRIETRADNLIISTDGTDDAGSYGAYIRQTGSVKIGGAQTPKGTFDIVTRPFGFDLGNILGGVITAKTTVLDSGKGNIGTPTSPVSIESERVSFQARKGTDQSAFLSLTPRSNPGETPPGIRKVVLANSYSSGSLNARVNDAVLQVEGSITAHHGLLYLSGQNGVVIANNGSPSTIQASKGSVELYSASNIILEQGTKITAQQGHVRFFAGGAESVTENPFPSGDYPSLRIRTFNSGALFMDPGTITATGPLNRLTADGGFIEAARGQSGITLMGDVTVKSTFTPIAFAPKLTSSDTQFYKNKSCRIVFKEGLQASTNEFDELNITLGECLIHATRKASMILGNIKTVLPRGFVGIVDVISGDHVCLKNLSGERAEIFVKNTKFTFEPGQALLLSPAGPFNIPCPSRNLNSFSLRDHAQLQIGEFSISSELAHNGLLKSIRSTKSTEHKQIADLLLKTAACVSLVTASHGPFRDSR